MIQIDYRDRRSIYEQVRDEFKKLIVSGGLLPGEKLPSVRELASMLAINPNTIQRAYRELEQGGFVYSVAGKGSFVSEPSKEQDYQQAALLESFDSIAAELRYSGINTQELINRLLKSDAALSSEEAPLQKGSEAQ